MQDGTAVTFTFTDPGSPNHCVGDAVKATVKVHYNWLNFLRVSHVLSSLGTDITASATMRLEKAYDPAQPASYWYTPSAVRGTCPP